MYKTFSHPSLWTLYPWTFSRSTFPPTKLIKKHVTQQDDIIRSRCPLCSCGLGFLAGAAAASPLISLLHSWVHTWWPVWTRLNLPPLSFPSQLFAMAMKTRVGKPQSPNSPCEFPISVANVHENGCLYKLSCWFFYADAISLLINATKTARYDKPLEQIGRTQFTDCCPHVVGSADRSQALSNIYGGRGEEIRVSDGGQGDAWVGQQSGTF